MEGVLSGIEPITAYSSTRLLCRVKVLNVMGVIVKISSKLNSKDAKALFKIYSLLFVLNRLKYFSSPVLPH